jgi:hypothetical protein
VDTKLTLRLNHDVIERAKIYAKKNNLDLIVTRNLKDFKKSKSPVLSAGQFLKTI